MDRQKKRKIRFFIGFGFSLEKPQISLVLTGISFIRVAEYKIPNKGTKNIIYHRNYPGPQMTVFCNEILLFHQPTSCSERYI